MDGWRSTGLHRAPSVKGVVRVRILVQVRSCLCNRPAAYSKASPAAQGSTEAALPVDFP